MPRKAYVADLQRAVDGVDIAGISNIQCGGDDGEFTFHCVTHGGRLEISALIPGMLQVLLQSLWVTEPRQEAITSWVSAVEKDTDTLAAVISNAASIL